MCMCVSARHSAWFFVSVRVSVRVRVRACVRVHVRLHKIYIALRLRAFQHARSGDVRDYALQPAIA